MASKQLHENRMKVFNDYNFGFRKTHLKKIDYENIEQQK